MINDIKLEGVLQEMKYRLPRQQDKLISWWKSRGREWLEELRAIAIKYRNIGHDWQFSEAQKELLRQYYDANILLVDCLNSDCYISQEARAEIEDTLLLSISSIQARQTKK
jgi:predicted NACHT family NTPase